MKVITMIGIVLTFVLLVFGGSVSCSSSSNEKAFPSFVYSSAMSLESYEAASSLPEKVMVSMPCYCGCGALVPPHRNLHDCFYNADGSYNNHAAGCDLCGKIALDVQRQYEEGKDLKAIRASIDSKYSVYGPATDTPYVAVGG